MNHRRRWWITLPAAAAVAAVAASASTGSANAARYMTVSQGASAAALAGYTPFDPTDPTTPETVTFVLRARNENQLESQVQAGMPGGYLSTSRFANTYGQPKVVVLGIQAYLAFFGIHSHAMPDNLDIQTTGTAGQYNNAFQIIQQNYMVPSHGAHGRGHGTITVHGSPQNPKVPSEWGPYILAILGLSSYPTEQSDMVGTADGVTTQGLNNTALQPSDSPRGITSTQFRTPAGQGTAERSASSRSQPTGPTWSASSGTPSACLRRSRPPAASRRSTSTVDRAHRTRTQGPTRPRSTWSSPARSHRTRT